MVQGVLQLVLLSGKIQVVEGLDILVMVLQVMMTYLGGMNKVVI